MMWLILLRMVATLLLALIGGAACLILIGIGQKGDALQLAVMVAIGVWFIQPNAEQREDFAAFQKAREPWTPPDR
jgi:hypothetical protein